MYDDDLTFYESMNTNEDILLFGSAMYEEVYEDPYGDDDLLDDDFFEEDEFYEEDDYDDESYEYDYDDFDL